MGGAKRFAPHLSQDVVYLKKGSQLPLLELALNRKDDDAIIMLERHHVHPTGTIKQSAHRHEIALSILVASPTCTEAQPSPRTGACLTLRAFYAFYAHDVWPLGDVDISSRKCVRLSNWSSLSFSRSA